MIGRVSFVLLALVVACGGCLGEGGSGGAMGQQFPSTEQGICEAIAEGGGPHTFDCDGPTTVVTETVIVIDNDVILDGEGNLTLDGDDDHAVFMSPANLNDPPATAELRGFRITGAPGFYRVLYGAYIAGYGVYIGGDATLTLTDSTVSENEGDGIRVDGGTLTLLGSSVSNNQLDGVVSQGGSLTILNSTVSDNPGNVANYSGWATLTNSTIAGGQVGIVNFGQMTIRNSTIALEGTAFGTADVDEPREATFANTIVYGDCEGDVANHVTSNGYNIESLNTCGFDQPNDQVDVSAEDLKLGPLQDNGGPTKTRALGADSVAIDAIPAEDCVDADGAPLTSDQRGFTRPAGAGCDVGAFEVQP